MKKTLILKGLGKAKVRKIARLAILHSFNEFIEYHSNEKGYRDQSFTLHLGGEVEGWGLPELGDDDYYTLEDLVFFLGGEI